MKKVFSVLGYIVLVALLLFGFCGKIVSSSQDSWQATYDEGYEAGKEEGYDNGYELGYIDGARHARSQIFEKLYRDFSVLAYLNDPDYGMCPEKAIDILSQYESGRSTSIAQIERSIRLLKDFFSDLESLIKEVQYYDVG